MDLATLIGLVTGVSLLLWAVMSKAPISTFIDVGSIAIVGGGAVAAALISFPINKVFGVAKVLKKTVFAKSQSPTNLISDLVRFAEIARRDGILALENVTHEISDSFLVSGIQMAVDGTDPELIEQILTNEMECVADRHADGRGLLENIGKYAPAFGMIGTLIGLVIMLQNMDDPNAIGPGMAVALLTTLYGALIANLVALPLADKLGVRSSEELLLKSIVIRGVMSIQAGDNPRVVEQKLKTFLPPGLRAGQDQKDRAAA